MLTVQYVRDKYPKEYGDLSDAEVQKVIDFFYTFGYIMVDDVLKNKEAFILKQKNI